ncbi:MAG: Rpn family recombination-promoting nuclease/putative transposase [Planctomycetota bacterium]
MTSQPHDALFKASLTPEAAVALCRAVLPAELAGELAQSALRVERETFIEEALRERRSDVLLSASREGRDTLLYVLFEHQSSVDPLMAFRVLRYVVRLWSWWLEQEERPPGRLPLVIPIVVYHGVRPWSAAQEVHELVELPGSLAGRRLAFVPSLRYVLDDLGRTSDEELRARGAPPFAAIAWIFLRHVHEPELGLELWIQCADLLRELLTRSSEWRESLERLVRYSMQNGLTTAEELSAELSRSAGPDAGRQAMNYLEQLELKGERRLLLRLLRKRFGSLPAELEQRVESASQTELERWADRVLTAASLEEVFAEGDA